MPGKKVKIMFKILKKGAKLPSYAHKGDAGFDVFTIETKTIKSGSIEVFSTGLASQFPEDWFVSFRDRGGLAAKHGVHTLAGVVDSGYRGEWKVVLINLGKKDYTVKKGERITQGILLPITKPKLIVEKRLSKTKRGSGRFGSTGRR